MDRYVLAMLAIIVSATVAVGAMTYQALESTWEFTVVKPENSAEETNAATFEDGSLERTADFQEL